MRLSNRKKPIYNFVLTLINVLIVIGLAGFILEKKPSNENIFYLNIAHSFFLKKIFRFMMESGKF